MFLKGWYAPGKSQPVQVNPPIKAMPEQSTDETKHAEAFAKQKAKYPKCCGVALAKGVQVNFYSDGKYDGIIWGTRQRLSGTYKRVSEDDLKNF